MSLFFNPITLSTSGTDQPSGGGQQETDREGDTSSGLPMHGLSAGAVASDACIPPGDQGRSAWRRDLDMRSRRPIVVGRGPVVCLKREWRKKSMGFSGRGVILGVVAGLALLGGSDADAAPPESRGLDIYFIDVQGGAATLLVTPERESILIDSGWPGLEDRDPKRIVQVLKERGRMRPSRPPDHDPLAHGPLRRRGRAGEADRDQALLGPGAPRPGRPRRQAATSPTARRTTIPLGMAYRQASKGKRTVRSRRATRSRSEGA